MAAFNRLIILLLKCLGPNTFILSPKPNISLSNSKLSTKSSLIIIPVSSSFTSVHFTLCLALTLSQRFETNSCMANFTNSNSEDEN